MVLNKCKLALFKHLYFLNSDGLSFPLREKVSVFGFSLVRIFPHLDHIRTSPYSVRMQENMDQNNSKYGHFLRNVLFDVVTQVFLIAA